MEDAALNGLELGVVGNCSFGALIDRRGRVVWACLPRFDSDPTFCSLLNGSAADADGIYEIELDGCVRSEQHYIRNTAILVTTLYDEAGSAVEITDFAPRYKQYGRIYRPIMLVRQVSPLIGQPRIHVRLRPSSGYGAAKAELTHGSNHIRYVLAHMTLRLTTNAPVSFVLDEVPFVLEEPITLFLGPDESLTQPITRTGHEFFENTLDYWQEWSRFLSIPFEWQEAVIRAAITLKLCSFEESGAIIAAMTTSIPEAADSGRNWDYRYCWLRDAYFVVHALNRLGATRTMEEFLRYITNIAAAADGQLQPVYGVTLDARLAERSVDTLPGYRGMGPVRVGNQAYEQIQNDVYGAVVLASTQIFFDQRLTIPGYAEAFERLESLGRRAVEIFDQPDAGLWEFRQRAKVHTFSSVMCWAACDRLAKIAGHMGISERAADWRGHADRIRGTVIENAWNAELGTFVTSFGGDEVDASLLLLHEIGFIEANDPRFAGTVAMVEKRLRRGSYLMRYAAPDDFGVPETAFAVCTFWYIDALDALGRHDEARELFDTMLDCRNHLGLLSEDIDPETGALWGNFPQTYSMVGLINSAMRLSKSWEEAL